MVDLSLPLEGNLQGIRRLRDRCPGTKLVLLSVHDQPGLRRAALEAGADGVVLKRSMASDLLPTVDSLLEGWGGVCSNGDRRRVQPPAGN